MSRDDAIIDDSGHEEAVANPATGNHGDGHGPHDPDAVHTDEPLGPVDLAAWGAGILGVAIAIVIAACLSIGTTGFA